MTQRETGAEYVFRTVDSSKRTGRRMQEQGPRNQLEREYTAGILSGQHEATLLLEQDLLTHGSGKRVFTSSQVLERGIVQEHVVRTRETYSILPGAARRCPKARRNRRLESERLFHVLRVELQSGEFAYECSRIETVEISG
ncbi:MAG TPA: hypothetical protein VFH17_02115 [Coriobacteriia bacterium]|nr:hypothetical protein [Coriobacteriia bacterium]